MSEAVSSANPRVDAAATVRAAAGHGTARGKATRAEATQRHQIRSAQIRAAALGKLLVAIAPNRGSAITLKVTNKSGASCRATFSHASVLFILRRALAEAQAAALAVGQPQARRITTPVRKAASA